MGRASLLAVIAGLLVWSGCNRGYQSASELEHAERGPNHCASSCQQLGMRMSAFVLVESNVAGCVCEPMQPASGPYGPPPGPPPPAPQPQSSRSATGAAAGWVVVEIRRQAAQQAAQQQAMQPK